MARKLLKIRFDAGSKYLNLSYMAVEENNSYIFKQVIHIKPFKMKFESRWNLKRMLHKVHIS